MQWINNKGCRWVLFGWSGFIAENLILSQNRDLIIDKFGEKKYHLIYNTCSSIATIYLAIGYFRYRQTGPLIRKNGKPLLSNKLLPFAISAMGLGGLLNSFPKLQVPVGMNKEAISIRCPIDFRSPDAPDNEIYGLERVCRYPGLWSMSLMFLGPALTAKYVHSAIFFGFPMVFALIGSAHQDYRFLKSGKLSRSDYEKTSLIPFVALLNGKQKWSELAKELKWLNISLGMAMIGFI